MAAAWPPADDDDAGGPPTCDNCGHAVSHGFYRVWSVDGHLPGCRHCQPRSVRFSRASVPDDLDGDFDLDRYQ